MLTTMNKPAPCGCCANVCAYIEAHLDPGATLRADDDAAQVVAGLDRVFADEGGSKVTTEQMQDYLDTLAPDCCRECGASLDDGEGYDGLCGNCADVAEGGNNGGRD